MCWGVLTDMWTVKFPHLSGSPNPCVLTSSDISSKLRPMNAWHTWSCMYDDDIPLKAWSLFCLAVLESWIMRSAPREKSGICMRGQSALNRGSLTNQKKAVKNEGLIVAVRLNQSDVTLYGKILGSSLWFVKSPYPISSLLSLGKERGVFTSGSFGEIVPT